MMYIISFIKSGQGIITMYKINSYVMPIHLDNGSTVVSSVKGGFMAMQQRVARLKRELKLNRESK